MDKYTVVLENVHGKRGTWQGEAEDFDHALRKARFQWPFDAVVYAAKDSAVDAVWLSTPRA